MQLQITGKASYPIVKLPEISGMKVLVSGLYSDSFRNKHLSKDSWASELSHWIFSLTFRKPMPRLLGPAAPTHPQYLHTLEMQDGGS